MDLPPSPSLAHWPYLPTLSRLLLALALGLFVGLERERRGKEAGVRTFAFAALLGCMGALLSDTYAVLSIALLALLVIFLNLHSLRSNEDTEMTTSAALLVTGFVGVLCGKGHTFTPVAVGIATAGLLAWKQPLSGFSLGLTEQELRSAVLLGILAFVIYPVLPGEALDPWGLVEPRAAWITVILIAAIGFLNYLLLKLFGKRGVEMTGFFGGLVNSTVAVTELASRVRDQKDQPGHGDALLEVAYRGTVLAVTAMLVRNGLLLALLAPATMRYAALPLALMFLGSLALVWPRGRRSQPTAEADGLLLPVHSPFSLKSALQFGLVFLLLDVTGTLAQRHLGPNGFYGVSLIGGFISSASSVASAGNLAAHGKLSHPVAAIGALLACLTSALMNLPLIFRIAGRRKLVIRVSLAVALIILLGLLGLAGSVGGELLRP